MEDRDRKMLRQWKCLLLLIISLKMESIISCMKRRLKAAENLGKVRSKITGDRSVEIMKAGEMRGSLFFEKDKRTLSCYETPYGQLHFGVWTTGIDLDVKEDEIFAGIRYRMEMEDHPMADCCVKIHACTKGEKSAQMVKAMMERQKKELSEE